MAKRKTPYWWRVIAEAKRRKKNGLAAFTDSKAERASNWQTCACGKQDPRIPREFNGAPEDCKLALLGLDFYLAVSDNEPAKAERTLKAIEKRSAEVLAQASK